MASISIIEILIAAAGVSGAIGYVAGYALLQLGVLRASDFRYTMMNLASATLVLFSTIGQFNLAVILINVSWIVIGLGGLAKARGSDAVRPAVSNVRDRRAGHQDSTGHWGQVAW